MASKKTTKKRVVKKRRSNSKPIGFVKQGKSYKLVFGSKTKPRLGKTSYKSKSTLVKKAKTLLK